MTSHRLVPVDLTARGDMADPLGVSACLCGVSYLSSRGIPDRLGAPDPPNRSEAWHDRPAFLPSAGKEFRTVTFADIDFPPMHDCKQGEARSCPDLT